MIDKIIEKVTYAKDIYTNINLTERIPINVETLDIFDQILLYLTCEKTSEAFELLEELLDFFSLEHTKYPSVIQLERCKNIIHKATLYY